MRNKQEKNNKRIRTGWNREIMKEKMIVPHPKQAKEIRKGVIEEVIKGKTQKTSLNKDYQHKIIDNIQNNLLSINYTN